jgi:DNA-binding NarL/FixJ family response regulator
MALRVVVADDSYLAREAVTHVLAAAPDIDVVAVCDDRDSLMAAVDGTVPDVVVTDIRMPPDDDDAGVRVAVEMRRSHPQIGVVVLSQYLDAHYALALLAEGSDGRAYLLKERIHDRKELVAAIQATANGGSVIDPKVVELLVAARSQVETSPLAGLTQREREILAEIAQGKSNAGIAETLALSKRAVEKHINSIFTKLELPESEEISRRVKATLFFLADQASRDPDVTGPGR